VVIMEKAAGMAIGMGLLLQFAVDGRLMTLF
jgi:hypothetical protein